MKLLEDITLSHAIEIDATAEQVFDFFLHIVDDRSYRAWHPQDHVALRWLRGEPWQQGSIVYAEEYFHGKLHKLKFVITEVIPNRKIAFVPSSRLLRIYFPGNTLAIEPKDNGCIFTATGCVRVGRLIKIFARKKLEHGLACAQKHMREEGENLKRILEEQRCVARAPHR